MSTYPSGAQLRAVPVGNAEIVVCDSAPDAEPRADRRPVVLIPGTGGTTGTDFRALYPMLAGVRRTIGLDLAPDDDSTVDSLADQISSTIDAVVDEPVHLVGYSLGAVLAAATAAKRPDALTTLTLINGWRLTDRHQRLRNAAWRQLLAESSGAWSDLALATAHSAVYLRGLAPYQLDDLRENRAQRRDPRAELAINAHVDITDALSRVTAPTLVIGSTYDAMVPVHHSRELFGAIENARYLEIAAGHAVTTERPAEVFAAIEDFTKAPDSHTAGAIVPSYQV